MSRKTERKLGGPDGFSDDLDDIDIEHIVNIIAPEGDKDEDELRTAMKKEAGAAGEKNLPKKEAIGAEKREGTKTAAPADSDPPPKPVAKTEEESIERLVRKIDEVYQNLDDLSKGIVQVNKEFRGKMEALTAEMSDLSASFKDASQAMDHAKGAFPTSQAGQKPEQPGFAQPPPQQQAPPPSYQPPSYGYQSPPPPQQGYFQQQPPQQGYYSQQPPSQAGFFQQQQPPPPPPGASPEEAVTKGAESLRGTIFDDVISAFNQVASIVFSRLLDAREKILRIDPTFPVQDFEPVLSELRANPRMKLSQVDKRKLVERMLFWSSRLPRPP
ncbi:MAG: hypothetical protein WED04_12025 [Promethearchaeati archaeon SRVP18_Atabeyarchaeia-1]